MVRPVNCNCAELDSLTIDTYEQFERIKEFFKKCVERGTLVEIKVSKPFYTWSDGIHTTKWYATKWYKCQTCGWDVNMPVNHTFFSRLSLMRFQNISLSGSESKQ